MIFRNMKPCSVSTENQKTSSNSTKPKWGGKFGGLSNSIDYGTNMHDHPDQQDANCIDEECKYQIVGRQICLGECTYVFNRVWKATLEGCNEQHKEGAEDHLH